MQPNTGTATCTTCGVTKPLTAFEKRGDGLRKQCRECRKAAYANRPATTYHGMILLPLAVTTKKCNRCGVVKPAEEFGCCRGRKCTSHCRECRNEAARDLAPVRRSYYLEYSAGHKAETAERSRRSYERKKTDPEWRASRVRYMREWSRDNPDRVRAHHNKKRAIRNFRIAASASHYTAEDVSRKLIAQLGRCWWCGKELHGRYQVDHLIPLARGGSNGPENIVIACKTCNVRKNARLPHEWNGRLL